MLFFASYLSRLKKLWGASSYLILRDFFPQWVIDNGMLNLIYDPTITFDGRTFLLVALESVSKLNNTQEDKLLNNINRSLNKDEQEELDWVNT